VRQSYEGYHRYYSVSLPAQLEHAMRPITELRDAIARKRRDLAE
jgi:hypothetical protein